MEPRRVGGEGAQEEYRNLGDGHGGSLTGSVVWGVWECGGVGVWGCGSGGAGIARQTTRLLQFCVRPYTGAIVVLEDVCA